MATCSTATLIEQACANNFLAAATDVELYRALKHQLLCNIEAAGGGGGATAFTGLTDTFPSYVGRALQVLRVNAGETGIESVSISASTVTKFASADITLDGASTAYTVAHPLGATPPQVKAVLLCIANDAATGYLIGDETALTGWVNSSQTVPAFSRTDTATDIIVSLAGSVLVGNESNYVINTRSGSGLVNPSSFNNFALKIYAWL